MIWFLIAHTQQFQYVSLQTLHERLKVILTGLNVHGDGFLFDIRIGANHHDVGAWRELVDEADEFLVSHDHRLELVVRLDARKFELLDNVGDFLEPMVVFVVGSVEMRDHQESALLKQNYFVRPYRRAELLQA